MKRAMKLLAVIGFCGAGISILAFIFNLGSIATVGFVVFFSCVASVIACTAIKGYNPAES